MENSNSVNNNNQFTNSVYGPITQEKLKEIEYFGMSMAFSNSIPRSEMEKKKFQNSAKIEVHLSTSIMKKSEKTLKAIDKLIQSTTEILEDFNKETIDSIEDLYVRNWNESFNYGEAKQKINTIFLDTAINEKIEKVFLSLTYDERNKILTERYWSFYTLKKVLTNDNRFKEILGKQTSFGRDFPNTNPEDFPNVALKNFTSSIPLYFNRKCFRARINYLVNNGFFKRAIDLALSIPEDIHDMELQDFRNFIFSDLKTKALRTYFINLIDKGLVDLAITTTEKIPGEFKSIVFDILLSDERSINKAVEFIKNNTDDKIKKDISENLIEENLVEEGVEIAKTIVNENIKKTICKVLIKIKRFEKFAELTKTISNDIIRKDVFFESPWETDLASILELSKAITDESAKKYICERLIYEKDLFKALEATKLISNIEIRDFLFLKICDQYILGKEFSKALDISKEEIIKKQVKESIFFNICNGLIKAGEYTEAAKLGKTLEEPIRIDICNKFMSCKRFVEVGEIAQTITDVYTKGSICETLIKLKQFESAIKIANTILTKEIKNPLFRTIFKDFINNGNVKQAIELTQVTKFIRNSDLNDACKSLIDNGKIAEADSLRKCLGEGLPIKSSKTINMGAFYLSISKK